MALIVSAVVIAVNFEQPVLDISETTMTISTDTSTGTPTTKLTVVTTVDIENPNGWPFRGSISEADADIKSVDGSGNNDLAVGTADLPDSLHIGTHDNVTFNLTVTTQPMTQESQLFQRLLQDCGPNSPHQTHLDVVITDAKVHVFWAHVTLPDFTIPNLAVPCDLNLPPAPVPAIALPHIEVQETPETVLV